ncbi:MAG: HipA domain-containing protein [Acidimicrobiales bacterium]
MATDELAVWLYGNLVAVIERERGRLRLTYTETALSRYELGTPLLSLSLPLRPERFAQGTVRAFLDGLLPEGESRRVIARRVGASADDTFGLIRALGRDCAGAVVIQPGADPPPPPATTTTAAPLEPEEIDSLVRELRSTPLGVGGRVRISLAGVQDKLVLTKMPNGDWGRPVDGTPSTHILKPEIAAYPLTVANEAFCMRVAKHIGLDVADVETTEIAGRKLIVVERYDRRIGPDGSVHRIHQEDFCQAAGLPPELKYEEHGGSSFARLAQILVDVGQPDSLDRLLGAVFINSLIGNGDAHAKNYSLLHEDSGRLRLSPLYDLVSTSYYGDNRLAMFIDNVQRTDRVSAPRMVNEGIRWGMARRRATGIIDDLLGRAPAALDAALDETMGVPSELVALMDQQLVRLRSE